jgi:H+/Na+-translocating ferredoxin:NAD+ oxidoreductase subunit G
MTAPLVPEGPAPVWPMYRALVGIGLLCGLSIVTVFELTRPVIANNRAEALEQAIFQVLPAARSSRAFRRADGGGLVAAEGADGGERVYAGYDDRGTLVGIAVEAGGMGYQDTIRVLYGYAPPAHAIVGLRVLESKETPGLGDRIEVDPAFQANFERLDVGLAADGAALAHAIAVVGHGTKTAPWQIDGITGATISSKAVGALLDKSAGRWIPELERHLDDLRAAAPAAAPPQEREP